MASRDHILAALRRIVELRRRSPHPVAELQIPGTGLGQKIEQVIAAVIVPDIEGIARRGRIGLPLRKAIARFQIERDLPLVDVENVAHGGAGELVIGGIGIYAAAGEVNAVAGLGRHEVHRAGSVDHHRPGEARRRGARRHDGSIG